MYNQKWDVPGEPALVTGLLTCPWLVRRNTCSEHTVYHDWTHFSISAAPSTNCQLSHRQTFKKPNRNDILCFCHRCFLPAAAQVRFPVGHVQGRPLVTQEVSNNLLFSLFHISFPQSSVSRLSLPGVRQEVVCHRKLLHCRWREEKRFGRPGVRWRFRRGGVKEGEGGQVSRRRWCPRQAASLSLSAASI